MANTTYFGGLSFGMNSISAENFSNPFGDQLLSSKLSLGVEVPVVELGEFDGGSVTQLVYSSTHGNEQTWGSRRHQFMIQSGWAQWFSQNIFLRALLGYGLDINYMSLGRGVQLEQELGHHVQLALSTGVNLCFGKGAFCMRPNVGYQIGGSLGAESYLDQALLFGIEFAGKGHLVDRAVFERITSEQRQKISELQHRVDIDKPSAVSLTSQRDDIARKRDELTEENERLKLSPPIILGSVFDDEMLDDRVWFVSEKNLELVAELRNSSWKFKLHSLVPSASPAAGGDHPMMASLKYGRAIRDFLIQMDVDEDRLVFDGHEYRGSSHAYGTSLHDSPENLPQHSPRVPPQCADKPCVFIEVVHEKK